MCERCFKYSFSNIFVLLEKITILSLFPFPIIQDGMINIEYLAMINKDEEWLNSVLKENNIESYKNIFLFVLDNRGPYIVLKELENKE
jgi:uncharacterized membrane protein YcaP (DUF421 family)